MRNGVDLYRIAQAGNALSAAGKVNFTVDRCRLGFNRCGFGLNRNAVRFCCLGFGFEIDGVGSADMYSMWRLIQGCRCLKDKNTAFFNVQQIAAVVIHGDFTVF